MEFRRAHSLIEGKQVPINYRRRFFLISVAAFLIYSSSSMIAITLPKYAFDLGSSAQAIGLLAGIFAMCALLMRTISGQIVDNEDKVRLLRVTLVIILVSVFGLTQSKAYGLLLFFRGLNGFAWGIGSTLCMTIAAGCFTESSMATGIGVYGLGQVLAQVLAPVIALPVAEHFGYNTLYYVNVVLIALALGLSFFLRINYTPRERKYSFQLSKVIHVPAILPATMTMVNAIAKSSIAAFLVIYAGTISVSGIGMFFTVQAVTIFLFRPWISKLSDRMGALIVLIPCELLAAAGMILIAKAESLPVFLAAAVLTGISTAGEQPILMAECVRSADRPRRGSASNTSYMGLDIGNFIGSNLAGLLVALVGYRGMFFIFALPVLLYTFVFIKLDASRGLRGQNKEHGA